MIYTGQKLSIVMPAYNEGENIFDNLKRVSYVVSGFMKEYEIVVVNDGSIDKTKEEIKRYMKIDNHVCLVSYRKNRGKGYAIKVGVERASGDYIAFLDSDLDLPPEQIKHYMLPLINGETDVVIGSKMHKDSQLDYPLIRRGISLVYYCILRGLFHLKIKDTQTGLKVFRADALKSVISLIKTRGYAYDIEILVALNSRGYRIMEMPVKLVFHRGNGMGRIRVEDIIKVFGDTVVVFYRMNVQKYYRG